MQTLMFLNLPLLTTHRILIIKAFNLFYTYFPLQFLHLLHNKLFFLFLSVLPIHSSFQFGKKMGNQQEYHNFQFFLKDFLRTHMFYLFPQAPCSFYLNKKQVQFHLDYQLTELFFVLIVYLSIFHHETFLLLIHFFYFLI